ncbi:MAG TPA: sialidase family protein, partial [Phycisphaeraceae bacterium]
MRQPVELTRTVLFQGQAGSRTASVCFPSICKTQSGRLLASWRIGSAKDSADGTVCLSWSDDQGQSWSEPIRPFDRSADPRAGTFALDGVLGNLHLAALTPLADGRVLAAMMWLDRADPHRPMFNEQTEGLTRVQTLLAQSEDDGVSWSEPRRLDASPFDGL